MPRSGIIVGLVIVMLSVSVLMSGCGPDVRDPKAQTGTLPPTARWPVEPEQER